MSDPDPKPSGKGRPKYASGHPVANDVADPPAFTLTSAQLSALIGKAVADALASNAANDAPSRGEILLVDKQDLARLLGCSPAHIDHLRKRGMPWVPVGQMVRFEPPNVLAWLREQAAAERA